MNNTKLKQEVHSAVCSTLKEKIYVSPVDVLIKMEVLSAKDYENWRFARENNLKPSCTVYNQWGAKGRKIPLRFSKSGNSGIEQAYATHYVINTKRDKEIDFSKEELEDKRSSQKIINDNGLFESC